MATFEEKILAYLDGSLPSNDREAVLGAVHSSPEQRALFDAHVRLEGLYSLVAKPASAPLAVQRELAAKVPVLAARLPYLAPERARRDGAIVAFLQNASERIASLRSSTINIILITALALLAGGVWYFSSASHNTSSNLNSGSTSSGLSNNSGSSLNGAGGSSGMQPGGPQPSGNAPQNVGGSAAAAPSHLSEEAKHDDAASGTNMTHTTHRTALSTKSTSSSNPRTTPHDLGSAAASHHAIASKETNAPQANHSSELNQHLQNPQPPAQEQPPLPPLELKRLDIAQQPASVQPSRAMPINSLSRSEEPTYTPIRLFAMTEYRYSAIKPQGDPSDFARSYAGSAWGSSIASQGMEFGAEYEMTPWISVGLRGGVQNFVEAHAISHTQAVAGYPYLTKTINETALIGTQKPWTCIAATYSPVPANKLSYSFTAAAGGAFATSLAPILRGEIATEYQLSNAFAFRAAASYEADWLKTVTDAPANANGSSPSTTGISVGSSISGRPVSQAFGISLGIAFRP